VAGTNLPYVLGKSSPDLPSGLVRADVRAFRKGSGADYHQAFVDALAAADAVYVPQGTLPVSQGISVPSTKVVYGDGPLDQQSTSAAGPVVLLSGDIGSEALLTMGANSELRGLTLDANGNADVALNVPKDSGECRVWEVKAANGRRSAFSSDASRLTIVGCVFLALKKSGRYAYSCSGADMHVVAVRMIGGLEATARIDGYYGDYQIVHFQGSSDTRNDARITRNHNHFTNCRFDDSVESSLLVESRGNRFVSCRFYNGQPGRVPSAVRIDGTAADATQNEITAVFTDGVPGHSWDYLLELIGPSEKTAGTILGSGSCTYCAAPFNSRPAEIGLLTNAGGLKSRNEFVARLSGDDRSVGFRMPHGLLGTPASALVQPASVDAAIHPYHVSGVGPADISITFSSAPPSGRNNLLFYVIATM
jgi:hypothetical protein